MRHTKPLQKIGLTLSLTAMLAAGYWTYQSQPEKLNTSLANSLIQGQQQAVAGKQTATTANRTKAPVVAEHQTPLRLEGEPFARSLEGTDIDGHLRADQHGNLIVELEVRDFFDYFLNTVGEVPAEEALANIKQLARQHLPEEAAEQALELLDRYLEYKQQAIMLEATHLDPELQFDPHYQLGMFRDGMNALKQIRRTLFTADQHDAFFGLEEAYGDYTLAMLGLQLREDLSDSERRAQLEWHRQQLPEVIRRTEENQIALEQQQAIRQKALASAETPAEAGQRLQALGLPVEQVEATVHYLEAQQTFDRHFAAFDQQRAALSQAGLAEEDLKLQQEQLLQQFFADEQSQTWARLRMLDDNHP
ncbi:MAG: lipase chaperone [Marinobacter sp.]|nr:lipase chaperone [Marinobacter sp.]